MSLDRTDILRHLRSLTADFTLQTHAVIRDLERKGTDAEVLKAIEKSRRHILENEEATRYLIVLQEREADRLARVEALRAQGQAAIDSIIGN